MDEFFEFLRSRLVPGLGEELADQLLATDLSRSYFMTAFTHKSFPISKASKRGKFDYEVFEKLGDKVLAAAFQKWLVDILYPEVRIPSLYADIEKIYTATEFLAELTEKLGFDKWIKTVEGTGNNIDKNMKEDVFEAFVGAISMAGDLIVEDFGFCIAKRWIYQVYNTYTRDKIDPKNPSAYIDYRTQINEIWNANGWGSQDYITTSRPSLNRRPGDTATQAAVNLKAPNTKSFPEQFKGKVIGSGTGRTIKEATEKAAEQAVKTLKINYSQLKDAEVVFDRLGDDRLKKLLRGHPKVLDRLLEVVSIYSDTYKKVSVRTAKVGKIFVAQLRVEVDGVIVNAERARNQDKTKAIVMAVEKFIENVFVREYGKKNNRR